MRRDQLEHAIRAATRIVKQREIIIIGSQAILGSWDESELPAEAVMSVEVDMCPIEDDDVESLATEIDAAVGEMSVFHETQGFYIQGVGRRTAKLPLGWESRLVPVSGENTDGAVGFCLDPHDLCAAKLIAHREKDRAFVAALLEASLVDPALIAERLASIPDEAERAATAHAWLSPWL